jgi:hypothetical protein
MPPLSIWFVRTALLYLALGFTFGALLLSNKGVPYMPALWRLRSLHIEILMVGWFIQFAIGVAFWIFPRWWHEPRRGDERGAYLAYGLLNTGIWLVALPPLLFWPNPVVVAGRLAEVGAAVAFAWHIWPRAVGREG